VPAGDGEAVRRDLPRVVPIAQRERLLEHRADGMHKARARMIGLQPGTPASTAQSPLPAAAAVGSPADTAVGCDR
jgi:hypothetical protein